MAPQSYRLVIRSGPNTGKIFELDKSEFLIGRDIANDILINDAEISRRHARLAAQSGGYILEDNGSTNGTFVNGTRLVGPHLLKPGEIIFLGENVSLSYEVQSDPDATIVAGRAPFDQPRPEPDYDPFGTPAPEPGRVDVYSAPPAYTPPPPDYAPPPAAYTPAPAYTPPPPPYAAPAGSVENYPLEDEAPGRSRGNLVLGGCGLLVLVACLALVGFLFWLDSGGTARWCQYLGFLFGPYCP